MRSHKNDPAKGYVTIGLEVGMKEGRKINRNMHHLASVELT